MFRGTRQFTIGVSDDNINFETVVEGTLTTAIDKECDAIELESFNVPSSVTELYIKFTALNYYGVGTGLQYLGWE